MDSYAAKVIYFVNYAGNNSKNHIIDYVIILPSIFSTAILKSSDT
jgi:hypothetical protein